MILALTILAALYALTTLATFCYNILEWSLERDIGRTETAAHHARLALTAWAWPIWALTALRQAAKDATRD